MASLLSFCHTDHPFKKYTHTSERNGAAGRESKQPPRPGPLLLQQGAPRARRERGAGQGRAVVVTSSGTLAVASETCREESQAFWKLPGPHHLLDCPPAMPDGQAKAGLLQSCFPPFLAEKQGPGSSGLWRGEEGPVLQGSESWGQGPEVTPTSNSGHLPLGL